MAHLAFVEGEFRMKEVGVFGSGDRDGDIVGRDRFVMRSSLWW